jgi:hypothetical protein
MSGGGGKRTRQRLASERKEKGEEEQGCNADADDDATPAQDPTHVENVTQKQISISVAQ